MARQQGVAIIGGGIMGGDIAIIFAAGNWNVHLMSPSEKTRAALPARLTAGLQKLGAPLAGGYTALCQMPTNERLRRNLVTDTVGPFRVTGLVPADVFNWHQLLTLRGLAIVVGGGFLIGFFEHVLGLAPGNQPRQHPTTTANPLGELLARTGPVLVVDLAPQRAGLEPSDAAVVGEVHDGELGFGVGFCGSFGGIAEKEADGHDHALGGPERRRAGRHTRYLRRHRRADRDWRVPARDNEIVSRPQTFFYSLPFYLLQ